MGNDTHRSTPQVPFTPEQALALVGALPIGLTVFRAESDDPRDLRLVYANEEAAKQIGIDPVALSGLPVHEAFPSGLGGPDQDGAARMYQRVALGGERERMSGVRYGHEGKRDVWFDVLAVPLGGRLVAVLHDNITERLRKEQEIRGINLELERSLSAGDRRYRRIFGSAPVALCETDLSRVKSWLDELEARGLLADTHLREHPELLGEVAALWSIREANAAALPMLGGRGALPAAFGDVVREASEDTWLALLCALARGAPTFEAELTVHGLEGGRQLLLSMTIPAERADLTHVVVCLLDMTERKRLERELWAAQRMEAIGQLTGGVAHDFNNLLMVIGSYAGFVQDQLAPGAPALEDVQVIKDATERAAALTHQLLAFGRRQVQQLELMNLNGVVSELEKMLRRVIGAHIRLATVLAPTLGLVKADKLQVEQILMNLCVNARDAMPDGGQLSIATANADVDAAESRQLDGEVPVGAYVRLSVTDEGVGMDAAVRARIFEPFFTTKERGRGPGLGLSTVYGIVKQSQGHIWVDSQPGKGACFAIYLPRVEERRETRGSQRRSSYPDRRATVLVVEDEELVRTAARRILEQNGYRVLEAAHGHEALALCEQRQELAIELVVTDIVMPEMNGQELARRLALSRPNIKVIYVSGYADDALPQHGSLAPPTAYIQKPFTPDTLLDKVRELLGE